MGDLLDRSHAAISGAAAAAGLVMGNGLSSLGGDGNTDNGNGIASFLESSDTINGLIDTGIHFDLAHFSDPGEHGSRLSRLAHGLEYFGLMVGDIRQMLFWLAVFAVLLLIAVVTNPTEASFRTHLTELSFRRHLAVIRSNDDHPTDPASTSTSTSTSNVHTSATDTDKSDKPAIPTIIGGGHPVSGSGAMRSGTETPPIAPFRFSNHVAISLRTPMLYYRTLLFLSVAITSPIGPPAFLSDPIHSHQIGKKGVVPREKFVLYLGYLGHWVQVGILPRKMEWVWRLLPDGSREKGRKKNLAERPGVLEMRAMPGKEEVPPTTTNKGVTPLNPSKAGKLRKSGSSIDLHESATLPLHTSNPSIPVPALPESRRPSIVNLLPPPSTSSEPADTPALIALRTDLSKAQDTLLDLKNQLLSHEQSVSDAHASLQTTLDDLRNKRKEDDVERLELKGRTKSSEEQKRQAESARKEAEKKLKSAEGLRDGLKSKIEGFRKEMSDIRLQMEQSEKAVRVITEEGARFVVATREAVELRKGELLGLEDVIIQVDGESEKLGGKVKEAEERLKTALEQVKAAKKIGPEEEMMMMAAAYEAAAQEGYIYGHSGQGQGGNQYGHVNNNHSHPPFHPGPAPTGHHANANANWASQAAAYIAEAGLPLLDQSYTARSTQNHYRSRHADPKRLADLSGFEDFGPGAGKNGASKRSSGDGFGFGQVLGNATTRLPSTPPTHDDTSESDIYGLDPGSPNGEISTSFSANLLPQGLFRSLLCGDVTPVDDGAESTLEEALNFDSTPISLSPNLDVKVPDFSHQQQQQHQYQHQHDSGSESGDEAEDIWRSPMLDINHHNSTDADLSKFPVNPAVNALVTSNRTKRFSFSRLLPPSTTPPGTTSLTPPVLSGLPALPVARRWFSGGTASTSASAGGPGSTLNSTSAENIHAYPLFHPSGSNDSLGHPASLSLGLGGDSPFAPSKEEKKQLALKWGPLSKYRWASPSAASREGEEGSGSGSLGRSASLELNTQDNDNRQSRPKLDGPTSTCQRILPRNNLPTGTPTTKSKSPLIPSPNRDSTDVMGEDELEFRSLVPTSSSASDMLGTSAGSSDKDKKSFKFFGLKKSGSSIWTSGSGSSPGSQ